MKFYYSQVTNYRDVDGILNDVYNGKSEEQYIDMVYWADAYMEQYQMYTLIIILNMFNLLNALRIFRIIHWIMLIIERTFGVIGLFMMLLMPMQLGFAFFSVVLFGPYLEKYKDLIGALKEQIITMMGQQDSMSLMRTSYWATIIWTMSFIVFFAYFFVTASIVAFEDGFDDTVIERGYPSDFERASKWTWKQYIIWTLSWMPEIGLKEQFIQIKKNGLHYDEEEEQVEQEDKNKDENVKFSLFNRKFVW